MTILPGADQSAAPKGPRPPHSRPSLRREHIALTAVAVLLLGGSGYLLVHHRGGSSSPAPTGVPVGAPPATATVALPQLAPRLFLARSLAAARRSTGFDYSVRASVGQIPFTVTGTAGRREGVQLIVLGNESVVAEAFPGVTYVRGTPRALHGFSKFPLVAAEDAGDQWVVLHPRDKPFKPTTDGDTVRSSFAHSQLRGPLQYLTPARHNGVMSVGISGHSGHGAEREQVVIWIAAQGTPLPTEITDSGMTKQGEVTQDTLMQRWGRSLNLHRPANAAPYRSLSDRGSA